MDKFCPETHPDLGSVMIAHSHWGWWHHHLPFWPPPLWASPQMPAASHSTGPVTCAPVPPEWPHCSVGRRWYGKALYWGLPTSECVCNTTGTYFFFSSPYVIALETMVLTVHSMQSSGTSTHHLLVGFNDLPPLPVLFLHCLQLLHPHRERTLQWLQLLGEGETRPAAYFQTK